MKINRRKNLTEIVTKSDIFSARFKYGKTGNDKLHTINKILEPSEVFAFFCHYESPLRERDAGTFKLKPKRLSHS